MKDSRDNLQAEASLVSTENAESDAKAWNPPVLTTWKIEEETLGAPGSGPDGMGEGRSW
jgi:hypothetical protein